jgi:hypothetical protein
MSALAHLETNSEPHKCVYFSQIDINLKHLIWAKLAHTHEAYGAVYGNGKEAQRIYHEHFPDCVKFRFLSVNCRLRETGTAQGEEDQFTCCNLMRMFYSALRRIPPKTPTLLAIQLVWIVVLGEILYKSSSSILYISRRCRLH